jgi:hypothetical protein
VLIQPISADTHWPDAALGAIFSAILVIIGVLGIAAGRVLDRRGPRLVFLLAAGAGTGAMLAASARSASAVGDLSTISGVSAARLQEIADTGRASAQHCVT